MPTKLKVLLGIFLVDLVLRGILLAMGATSVVGLVVSIVIIAGVVKGSEGIRIYLIWGSAIGLAFTAVNLVRSVVNLGSHMFSSTLLIVAFLGSVVGIVAGAFTIWCLSNQEVQQWMLQKSLGFDDAET